MFVGIVLSRFGTYRSLIPHGWFVAFFSYIFLSAPFAFSASSFVTSTCTTLTGNYLAFAFQTDPSLIAAFLMLCL